MRRFKEKHDCKYCLHGTEDGTTCKYGFECPYTIEQVREYKRVRNPYQMRRVSTQLGGNRG